MRRWLSVAALALGVMLLIAPGALAQADAPRVLVGEIKGIINPTMAGYVSRVIDQAERENDAAVVFTMDTPGGLSDSMRDINLRILASRVPVVVYVSPDGARAGSAGVYITYAANLAAMAPATNIGSATPVAMGDNGSEAQMSPEMKNKVTNDAVAGIRALADQRGRNADFAEKAVREATNLGARDALQQNVVNYVARDLPDLMKQMDGASVTTASGPVTLHTTNAVIAREPMSAIEQFLLTITNPTIAYILLSLGSLGLIIELYNPGSIFPGVIGGISLLLAFYALGTLPVNLAGLGLIAFGLLLFALEPFLTSHGILGIGGALSFLVGSLILINVPDTAPYLQISLGAILGMTLAMLAFVFLILGAVIRSRRRHVVTGQEGLVGATGVARTDISPGTTGMVLVDGALWQAVTGPRRIPAGERVVVEAVDGLVLKVFAISEKVSREAAPPATSAAAAAPAKP